MKTVYICGDSFAATDPEYGVSWTELLTELLRDRAGVVNLATVAASNTLINVQVTEAVKHADFIIVLATAVTRAEAAVAAATPGLTLLERFQSNELVAYSILRPYRSGLTAQEQQAVADYHRQFFDLDLAIHRDCAIIANTLSRIQTAGIPFLFDQGGFEHPSFGGRPGYFTEYNQQRSQINLWDLGNTQDERPYYHIKEPKSHRLIADYYYNEILKVL